MMPAYLNRMIESCHQADLSNPSTRSNVAGVLIPRLQRHRKEIVHGLFTDRHSRNRSYLAEVMQDLKSVKSATRAATQRLHAKSALSGRPLATVHYLFR